MTQKILRVPSSPPRYPPRRPSYLENLSSRQEVILQLLHVHVEICFICSITRSTLARGLPEVHLRHVARSAGRWTFQLFPVLLVDSSVPLFRGIV